MDFTVISTYRCNSKCSMCHIWKYPTRPEEEVTVDTLRKLPGGFDNLNITGGEPTLRTDLAEMVDVLYPKCRVLEISTNGLRTEPLKPIVEKYPDVKIRYSLEGFGERNDRIRGEKNGFERKVNGLKELKELGGRDLGFGAVIQDDNIDQIVDLYKFAREQGFEFATSTLHNAFQFHKNDNFMYDRLSVARQLEGLVTEMMKTWNVKTWFRAYLNLGLMENILGHDRLIPCTAGRDFIFIDPWSDIYACNVRPDTKMGSLLNQSWDEIIGGDESRAVLDKVKTCDHNCWMVTTARCAMRNPRIPQLPKAKPFWWVVVNKLRTMGGVPIDFESAIDYTTCIQDENVARRVSYLDKPGEKRRVQTREDEHYTFLGDYRNR